MTAEKIRIRSATAEDAEQVARLAASVQSLHFQDDPRSYKPPSAETTLSYFRELLARPGTVTFIAEAEVVGPIGYAITVATATDDNPFKYPAEFVELDQMGVREKFRSKGVGRALHEHLVGYWKEQGIREIRLTVIAFNAGARRYYERQGFTECSRRMALRLS